METKVKESLRAARGDARAMRDAARSAARHARAAGNAEIEALIEDVEQLIHQIGEAAEPEMARARERVTDAVASTKRAIAGGATQVRRQAGEALEAGDSYVRGQPWKAVGAAAALGLIVGVLAFRR
jgi:ElaB/YqjD/DUF883 family membrane-anchored ribosome-binding protein